MVSGHGANPIFFNIKKIKIGRPEHSLNPATLLRPITSRFALPLPPPPHPPTLKIKVICVSPLTVGCYMVTCLTSQEPFLVVLHLFLTYKCTRKTLRGNIFVADRIFFGRLRPEVFNIVTQLKLSKFLQVLLTVSVIIFFDVIFRFVVYCFNQPCEQRKAFFERKTEREQFDGKH